MHVIEQVSHAQAPGPSTSGCACTISVACGMSHLPQDGCELFDQVEIDRWNARWNGGLFEGEQG